MPTATPAHWKITSFIYSNLICYYLIFRGGKNRQSFIGPKPENAFISYYLDQTFLFVFTFTSRELPSSSSIPSYIVGQSEWGRMERKESRIRTNNNWCLFILFRPFSFNKSHFHHLLPSSTLSVRPAAHWKKFEKLFRRFHHILSSHGKMNVKFYVYSWMIQLRALPSYVGIMKIHLSQLKIQSRTEGKKRHFSWLDGFYLIAAYNFMM